MNFPSFAIHDICDVSGFPLEMRATKYIVVNVTMDTLITAVILAMKLYN